MTTKSGSRWARLTDTLRGRTSEPEATAARIPDPDGPLRAPEAPRGRARRTIVAIPVHELWQLLPDEMESATTGQGPA